jgi:hypothetical protein
MYFCSFSDRRVLISPALFRVSSIFFHAFSSSCFRSAMRLARSCASSSARLRASFAVVRLPGEPSRSAYFWNRWDPMCFFRAPSFFLFFCAQTRCPRKSRKAKEKTRQENVKNVVHWLALMSSLSFCS